MVDSSVILAFFEGLTPYEQGRIVGRIFGAVMALLIVRALYKKFGS